MPLYFTATIPIIGINPYVFLPDEVLAEIFIHAGKDKSPIPVKGFINETPYLQNLVKFKCLWRLYINTTMLKNSPKRVGETIAVKIEYDPVERIVAHHLKFAQALEQNMEAKAVFERLTSSRQLENVRYIAHLKSEECVDRNVARAICFLLGKERFVGRDRP